MTEIFSCVKSETLILLSLLHCLSFPLTRSMRLGSIKWHLSQPPGFQTNAFYKICWVTASKSPCHLVSTEIFSSAWWVNCRKSPDWSCYSLSFEHKRSKLYFLLEFLIWASGLPNSLISRFGWENKLLPSSNLV